MTVVAEPWGGAGGWRGDLSKGRGAAGRHWVCLSHDYRNWQM